MTVDLTKTDERMELMMQYRITETYLRFHGIPEQDELIRLVKIHSSDQRWCHS